ncbi:hypothetical protein P3X46_031993 [Hevea brasiliensis]|uniref:Subtilisin-like protease n=1 Tax=Hevea brasiliensis TaxID=3981 RepID=A0ABQ9KNJ0_HEVBR|nr:subtilisin-like protease SBT1.8 [Hevea brasiliensis]KAJ9141455.1 hypothetical protein P3X46_031993 [Hevea brasiliensis]
MGSKGNLWLLALVVLFPTLSLPLSANAKQTYIVHMNHISKPPTHATHRDWYQSLTSTSDSILYTYTTAFHGFAAHLDPEEAESLRKKDAVLNVFEDKVYSVQTTRTPQFLGLHSNFGLGDGREFQEIEQAAGDVIVGVLDTGVWPESKSFDDTGLPEIPNRWKGKCISARDFDGKRHCNKKLIGARYFHKAHNKNVYGSKDVASPRDYNGHGTHCASTIAGSPVVNVSFFGYGTGTARGVATRARVAIYKVCWSHGCHGADILAAVERAILDGVDVLSMSIAEVGAKRAPYHLEPRAIAAFSAVQYGIFVSCAAGNSGPIKSTVSNVAPWIMSVGAGSIDRDFPAYVLLGNKQLFRGVSLYTGPRMGNKRVGLVYNKRTNSSSNFCLDGTLEPALVRGKVVICDIGFIGYEEKGLVVRKAGGVGMIQVNLQAVKEMSAHSHLLPTVEVGYKIGNLIKNYEMTDPNPTVILGFDGTVVNVRPSPMVADFSSRGPSLVTPQILKPDVIAPGVSILAAWSEAVSPSQLEEDKRITKFNIISGTSMACPHASGIVALLKAAYPTWSPSAIKSAIMTSAYSVDNTNSPIRDLAKGASSNPWAYGSGHVDPKKALSPGLVYDISKEDYAKFFCSLGYPHDTIEMYMSQLKLNVSCSNKFSDLGDLNYPSFSVLFKNKTTIQYSRELTNVGPVNSVYKVTVTAPSTVQVSVKPAKMVFKKVGEKQRYTATFKDKKSRKAAVGAAFGWIVWSNAQYKVSSPVAFTWT